MSMLGSQEASPQAAAESAGRALTLRRLLAPLLAPVVFGTLVYIGMRSAWYGPVAGLVLLTLAATALALLLTHRIARALQRGERALRQSEEHIDALVQSGREAERLATIAERERREKTALLESTSEGIYGVDLRAAARS